MLRVAKRYAGSVGKEREYNGLHLFQHLPPELPLCMGSTWAEYLYNYFDFPLFVYKTKCPSNSLHKWNNQITS